MTRLPAGHRTPPCGACQPAAGPIVGCGIGASTIRFSARTHTLSGEIAMTIRALPFTLIAALLLLTPLSVRGDEKQRKTYNEPPKMQIDPAKHYKAIFDTTEGKIVCDLFPKEA